MSVCSPPAMCGQPLICGGVGVGNDDANHSRTAGEKASSTEWWAISRGYLATRVRGTPVLPTDSVRVHAALSGRQGRKPRGDLSRNHSSAGNPPGDHTQLDPKRALDPHRPQQRTIVDDQEQRVSEPAECDLQLLDGVEVKAVRRLVENEEVDAVSYGPSKRRTSSFSRRHGSRRFVKTVDSLPELSGQRASLRPARHLRVRSRSTS